VTSHHWSTRGPTTAAAAACGDAAATPRAAASAAHVLCPSHRSSGGRCHRGHALIRPRLSGGGAADCDALDNAAAASGLPRGSSGSPWAPGSSGGGQRSRPSAATNPVTRDSHSPPHTLDIRISMMSSVGETGAEGENASLRNTHYSRYFIGSLSSLVLDAYKFS